MARTGIRDVASLAGVSHGTVSHYLNHPERVSQKLAERIQQAIETLEFVPNNAGRQLRRGSSTALAYIAPDVSNPYFASIAEGVEEQAAARGFSVFIANSNRSRTREDAYLDLFQQHQVSGMLVASHEPIEDRLSVIRRRGTPSVLIGQAAVDPKQASVSVDDVMGGRLAAEHLVSVGRRRIAYVGGPLGVKQVGDRLDGAGGVLQATPGAVMEILTLTDRTIRGGRSVARQILDRPDGYRPDGIFAANDLIALGLMHELVNAGVRIPEDIAVIGYDDIEFAAASIIPLSSIRSPHEGFGATAVDLLVDSIENPAAARHSVFQPELVARASTVGAAAGRE
ncbi:LacI family DNA-binding transcriptional regulator [Streptomyces sp. NPDC002795]|uniref:LacI family DNA-binding transcriptional regulator n=1 Tax=Streptomyces sp. NPDC002795 TaxID=3364665 RepID=UPI0036C15013